jgi:RNase P subunit RPR2
MKWTCPACREPIQVDDNTPREVAVAGADTELLFTCPSCGAENAVDYKSYPPRARVRKQ